MEEDPWSSQKGIIIVELTFGGSQEMERIPQIKTRDIVDTIYSE